MPSADATPSKKSDKVDIGKQLGQHDTAGVREKVRKWHGGGAGIVQAEGDRARADERVVIVEWAKDEQRSPRVANADEIVVIVEEQQDGDSSVREGLREKYESRELEVTPTTSPRKASSSARKPTPKTTARTKTQREIDTERKAWVRRKSKPSQEIQDELKQASAPKKRVVSDGHWRKDRSPTKKESALTSPIKSSVETPFKATSSGNRSISAWAKSVAQDDPLEYAPAKSETTEDSIKVKSGKEVKRVLSSGFVSERRKSADKPTPRRHVSRSRSRDRTRRRSAATERVTSSGAEEIMGDGIRVTTFQTPTSSRSRQRTRDFPWVEKVDHISPTYSRDRARDEHRAKQAQRVSRSPLKGCAEAQLESPIDDGIRVYSSKQRRASQPKFRSHRRERQASDSDRSGFSVEERPSSFTSLSPPPRNTSAQKRTSNSNAKSPRHSLTSEELSVRKRKSRRKVDDSPHDSPRSAHGLQKDPVEPHKSPEASSATRQDVKIENSTTPGAPKVFGNRIEAWLTSTPDPFVDVQKPTLAPHPPSTMFASKPTGDVEERRVLPTAATKQYLDDDDRRDRNSRRRESSRVFSYEVCDESKTLLARDRNQRAASTPTEDVPSPRKGSTPRSRKRSAGLDILPSIRDMRNRSPREDAKTKEEDAQSSAASSVDPSIVELPNFSSRRHMSGVAMRRQFPTTGNRLSTIASVETFHTRGASVLPTGPSPTSEQPTVTAEDAQASESGDTFEPNSLSGVKGKTSLKRKLTTHADLLSVLSLPRGENKSIVSARSIRTNRTKLATATVADLMSELATDEVKYQRELRTLVNGVIPVLLTCVLSKANSAAAVGLFGRAAKSDHQITQPIVDIGIALERLKSSHKRIPDNDPEALLTWAHSTARIYSEYLKAWRSGFQDIVVNLAPAEDTTKERANRGEGPPRNEGGDTLNGDGERVDVAFLLKRPLVRLKYLVKTFTGISRLQPSTKADEVVAKYTSLVDDARKRSNEERARLEDEAAANIDPTRARDPCTLAPLAGVAIDPHKCVRARDYFDMKLQHSSGQQVDCRLEILLREDAEHNKMTGDILFCEVSTTGRWLLFPPIQYSQVSARTGASDDEVVLMIRGPRINGQEWHEVLSLRSEEQEAGLEWVQMLSPQPVPPQLARGSSFMRHNRGGSTHCETSSLPLVQTSTTPQKGRIPSPGEIEVPIGEQASHASRRWDSSTPGHQQAARKDGGSSETPSVKVPDGPSQPRLSLSTPASPSASQVPLTPTVKSALVSSRFVSPANLDEAPQQSGGVTSLKRTKAKRYRSTPGSPAEPPSPRSSQQLQFDHESRNGQPKGHGQLRKMHSEPSWTSTASSTAQQNFSVWMPSSNQPSDASDNSEPDEPPAVREARPQLHRRTSSVPSLNMPTIPKLRKTSQPSTPTGVDLRTDPRLEKNADTSREAPASAPAKLQKRNRGRFAEDSKTVQVDTSPPPPPVHATPSPSSVKSSPVPILTPRLLKKHRRPSSPLKHEYEPSTATESSSGSDASLSDDQYSLTSDSSEDEDEFGTHKPLHEIGTPKPLKRAHPPASLYSRNDTLSPSQSASQAPYRTVPQQSGKASNAVASIFAWSDQGVWTSLHPEECSVVVTPGLIEAFDTAALNARPLSSGTSDESSPSTQGMQPLVALELTPLVPLRRGTALDISIRSPPTSNSKLRTGNNIMFRSRSPEECEALYALINQSRINNPTYIQLQHARGPYSRSNWAETMERRSALRSNNSSWWQLRPRRGNSYRASSTRAPSLAATESSIGTTNTAFSALRRFSGGSRLFNIARSTITSTAGSRSGTSESLSSGSSSPMILDPSQGTPLGITNAKIRLYTRESASKWRDMGSARMTIMLPPRLHPGTLPANPRITGQEKRIMVQGKTKGEMLLDVTLGESCFERVARTGIAVSVWEESKGPNGEIGQVGAVGGVGGRVNVFMIQMKSERDCAYTFSLVGKLRY
ncbi:hypothetical protein LTR50_006900 [Elasticomyces elasticus]|nr:hypothetical protein LTR50_006900 [Elasticomyces elasticus]